MNLILTSLNYTLDSEGNTTRVTASLQGSVEGKADYLSSTISLAKEDLPDGTTFDDMTKKQLQALAHKKLAAYTAVEATTESK